MKEEYAMVPFDERIIDFLSNDKNLVVLTHKGNFYEVFDSSSSVYVKKIVRDNDKTT